MANETAKYTVTGIAVMVAWGEAYQAFGSLNSSPWTARNFGADQAKADSMRTYVRIAFVNNAAMGALGSYLTGSWLPLLVTIAVSTFMAYLYEDALRAGMAHQSDGWEHQ